MVSVLLLHYFSRYYFVTIDCVADEGVGPEYFEDPEDFVEPGKQPFDHVYDTFLCMSYITLSLLQRNHDGVITTSMVATVLPR